MNPPKYRVAILANESLSDSLIWLESAKKLESIVEFEVVDLIADNWLDKIVKGKFDALLAKPGGVRSDFKELYDERIRAIEQQYFIFPSPQEIYLYENKRFLSFWLKANGIPHPKTHVFYRKAEAREFVQKSGVWPLVAKMNIGASSSGVKIIKSQAQALDYIENTFGKGLKREVGPKWKKMKMARIFHLLTHPQLIVGKFRLYKSIDSDVQKGFCIFQEYVQHDFEWRVVRIGDSFFAHKKMKLGELASGSLLKNYDNPPLSLFDFVKSFSDTHQLYSVAIDIFERSPDDYLVNEVQCIFGQSDQFQMMVDGKVGRYVSDNEQWCFEEGDFNGNQCFDLRLQWVLKNIQNESTIRQ